MDRAIAQTIARHLGLCDYAQTAEAMRVFTETRRPDTPDEIWFLEHPPVFTQGQAGRAEHLLVPGDIPVIRASRGGQITYHGPGQLVVYPLLDLHRLGMSVRELVTQLEGAMIATLDCYGIAAFADPRAPGVYVRVRNERCKIGSIGLRVSRGCSYHGLALNVDMDLEPFTRIDPCGYKGLRMTQIADLTTPRGVPEVAADLERRLIFAVEKHPV